MQQESSHDSITDSVNEVTPNPRRPAHACERCRSRHQRCNIGAGREVCSNCERAGAECMIRRNTTLKIRFSNVNYKQLKQRGSPKDSLPSSSKTSKKVRLRYAKGTPRIPGTSTIRISQHIPSPERCANSDDGAPEPTALPTLSPQRSLHASNSPQRESQVNMLLPPTRSTPDSLFNQPSPAMNDSNPGFEPWTQEDPPGSIAIPSLTENHPNVSWSPHSWEAPQSTPTPVSPCKDVHISDSPRQGPGPLTEEEAELVKYFFRVLAPWYDFADPQTRFRSYVAAIVLEDVAVLYAVLAVSSRHREVMMGTDRQRSSEYERLCLEFLIPSLSDTTKRLQESVLASAMLIRLLEEMTEPNEGETISEHAVSAPILLQIKQGNVQASEFSDAAMIVALRQDIFVANLTKKVLQPIVDHCNVDGSLEPTSDAMWAYRMVVHAARVTNFVYGDKVRDSREWDRLWKYLQDWDQQKPASFRPMYHARGQSLPAANSQTQEGLLMSVREPSCLPKFIYAYDCPVAGQQYFQLCRILLLAHDPRTPVLGLGRAEFLRRQENEIRDAVRTICGISESNQEYWPAKSIAGLVIGMCGELFSNPYETRELLEIVSQAEHHLGWPCLKVSNKLRDFWDQY